MDLPSDNPVGTSQGPFSITKERFGTDLQPHGPCGLVARHEIHFLAEGKWLTKSKKCSSNVIFNPNRVLLSSE